MKLAAVSIVALIVTGAAGGPSLAQEGRKAEQGRSASDKVFHAGGRHDQKLHEASLRARANGRKVEQVPYHAGGRHDAQAHEAAMKADARRASEGGRR